jgi:glucokinase
LSKQDSNKNIAIAVDVGGSKIAGGLWLGREGLSNRVEIPTRLGSEKDILDGLTQLIDELLHAAAAVGRVSAIGICIPGQIDYDRGTFYSPANLGLVDPVPLKKILEEKYGCPVCLENDANSGAIGEACHGAARGLDNFIYLSLGTGIGAGIYVEGKIYRGSSGLSGEVGHISIEQNGLPCKCGGRGCVENAISGRALSNRVEELLSAEPGGASILREIKRQRDDLTAKDVFMAARRNDPLARTLLAEFVSSLGTLIGNIINLLDPQAVVLGGGLAQNQDELLQPLSEFVRERMNLNRKNEPRVIRSGLGENAGIIGAAVLCTRNETGNEPCHVF